MRFPRIAPWLLILLLTPLTYAQARSGTIEGVVIDYFQGNHSDSTTVESNGKKYEFCLGCPGNINDSPTIIGDKDIRVGTRVRVTYTRLTRATEAGKYWIKALRVVNLPGRSTADGFQAFYAKFRSAINIRKRDSIRSFMASNFLWGLDEHLSRDEALRYLDKGTYWAKIRNAVAKTPRRCKEPYCNHDSRFQSGYYLLTSSFTILFKQDNGEWKWAGVLGD